MYENDEKLETIRNISQQDFLNFGMQRVAYLRDIDVEGRKAVAVCAADGTPIMVEHNYEAAEHAARFNDLEPVYLN